MVIKPRQTGIVAICACGTKQFIPSESAIKTGILYCPCGHLEKIEKKTVNSVMNRNLRAYLSKKSGRLYRPPAREERDRKQNWFEELA